MSLQFPTTLLPDNTDPVMAEVKSSDGGLTDSLSFQSVETVGGYTSHVYRFFGSGVSVDQFTVTYGIDETAKVKMPS